jgi:anti-sigma B factor antagonist
LTESLLLDVTTASDEAVLYVRGEVDIATADQLRERLMTAYAEHSRLVVDLSGAMFFDASGLRALHAVYREAVRHGHLPPILRGVRPLLVKSLKATGMYGLFTIEPGHQPGARSEAARRSRLAARHGASGRSTSSAVAAASAA